MEEVKLHIHTTLDIMYQGYIYIQLSTRCLNFLLYGNVTNVSYFSKYCPGNKATEKLFLSSIDSENVPLSSPNVLWDLGKVAAQTLGNWFQSDCLTLMPESLRDVLWQRAETRASKEGERGKTSCRAFAGASVLRLFHVTVSCQ